MAEPNYMYAEAAYNAHNRLTRADELCAFADLDLATKVIWHNVAATAARASGKLYLQAKKRLADEFGIELDEAWEARVLGGEHDVPFPENPNCSYTQLRQSLENIRMTAARLLNKERKMVTSIALTDLSHILRFCSEAGVIGSVLRDNAVKFRGSDPTTHAYTKHEAGLGCEHCGRPEEEHATI